MSGGRIVYLPLDSRPVNSSMPISTGAIAGLRIERPPLRLLGGLHRPASLNEIRDWTLRKLESPVDLLLVSIDMIAYGGLVQSRKPDVSLSVAMRNLIFLKSIRNKFKNIKIFAFNVNLRDSVTVTDDKSYELWQRQMRGEDFHATSPLRQRNYDLNRAMLDWAGEGVFDFLLIGKEDTATGNPYGTEIETLEKLAEKIGDDRAAVHAGTDELALLLIARHALQKSGSQCGFFIDAPKAMLRITPRFEPCAIGKTLERQIRTAGGTVANRVDSADAVLLPWLAASSQDSFIQQVEKETPVESAPPEEWFARVERHVSKGRLTGIVDKAKFNGASRGIIKPLLSSGIFFRLSGFAGWNTFANSSGTVIAQLVLNSVAGNRNEDQKKKRLALMERIVDDYLYQTIVRDEMASKFKVKIGDLRGTSVRDFLVKRLNHHFNHEVGRALQLPTTSKPITAAALPWNRIFEVGFKLDERIRRI